VQLNHIKVKFKRENCGESEGFGKLGLYLELEHENY